MSGPYDCLTCNGHGWISADDDDATPMETCPACKGSGEYWLPTVFCPSQEDRDLGRVEYVNGAWYFKDGVAR